MNFMSIISAIVTFIRFIPELIKIYKEVVSLLKEYEDKKDAKEKAEQIAKAVKKSRETKDTSDLEDMFGSKSFDVKFKVPEKKSLDLGAVSFDIKLQESVLEKVQEYIPKEESTPLKDIEKLVLGAQDAEPIEERIEEVPQSKPFTFGFFGRSSGVNIGASMINNVRMGQTTRMGSTFFLLAILLLGGCKTGAKNEPSYKPKLFAGTSEKGGLERKQTGEFIRATDPKMDDMVAMSYSTLSCVYKTYVNNCAEYKKKYVDCSNKDADIVKDIVNSN